MKFEFTHALVPENKINEIIQKSDSYRTKLIDISSKKEYEDLESSLLLVDDEKIIDDVKELAAKKINSDLEYIFLVGIGGSNLGVKAVYDALYGSSDSLRDRKPKMIFVDTLQEKMLDSLKELASTITSKESILIIITSKSGTTAETIANAELLISYFDHLKGVSERIVSITDENSQLWLKSSEKNISTLSIPKNVGGRFSVFSAVGLFPLLMAGININEFLRGAKEMRKLCLESINNPALISAAVLLAKMEEGISIHDSFIFYPELESLGKWYRQLLGESIGKEGKGYTPTVSIGSTDLHSVGQLYFGGPKDKITCLVLASQTLKKEKIVDKRFFEDLVPMINGKYAEEILQAIAEGTKQSFINKSLPFFMSDLETINEYQIGAWMQWRMMEIMYLGNLLNINTFDQPEVELYKEETRRILGA